MHNTRIALPSLTQLLPPQMLEPWSQRPIHIMILAHKFILAIIINGIEFIAPVAVEEEPFGWRGGSKG